MKELSFPFVTYNWIWLNTFLDMVTSIYVKEETLEIMYEKYKYYKKKLFTDIFYYFC